MKKKTFALCGLAALAGLSLASCGGKEDKKPSVDPGTGDTGDTGNSGVSSGFQSAVGDDWAVNPNRPALTEATNLDVYLNYKANSGVTVVKGSFTNPIENTTYNEGDLLPVWKEFQTRLGTGIVIKDATTYGSGSKDDPVYDVVSQNNFKSETDTNAYIDLFYNSTANINEMGSEGKAVNLLDYMDKLPNFRKFLQDNPAIEEEITYGRGDSAAIYFTPYLDGYNTVERLLVMDTEIVSTLLDKAIPSGLGQVKSGKGGNEKTVKEAKYQPFMNADYNYAADITVPVMKDSKKAEITIKKTDNIIKLQNQSLANGVTGAELITQFKQYLDKAFGHEIGAGKTYANYSEIFTSESAAYNADELIALMRVVKANPDVLYGSTDAWEEVETLFPRGQDNSRINNMIQFAGCVWGIQGMGAEAGHLYYTADAKLNDAETTQASYDALDNLAALYSEGLLLDNFYIEGTKANKLYVNKYFAKTDDASSFGLMMFDYCATQSAPNDLVNGLGTDPAKRRGFFEGKSVKGVMPILAPLSYWATEKGWDHTAKLGSEADRAAKTICRYYEENRAVKGNSWCIPTSSDNLTYALKLMDDMFSEEGNIIQNYGPAAYRTTTTMMGQTTQTLTQATLNWYTTVGGDIWDFYRQKMGSTQGVGHVRPTQLDITSTNDYSKAAYEMVKEAMDLGVVAGAKCTTENISWDSCVRVSCYPVIEKETSDKYVNITSFWANDKRKKNADGWVTIVVNGGTSYTGQVGTANGTAYTLDQLKAQMTDKNVYYLYDYARSVGQWAIPEYAKGTN